MPKHGEAVDHGRWCEECQVQHGVLYNCEHYPKELRAKLAEDTQKLMKNVRSRAWWKQQAEANGWDAGTLAVAMACYGTPTED
jgi:hypothetical protein